MEKIMISDNYKPVKLLGNGNSVNFSFDFPLISENFLQIFREKDGVQSLVGSGEYTVDFNDEGGVVTFNNAPEEGEIIAITRKIPLEQSTPYKTSSGFPADRIEGNFDTQIAIIQQMQEQVDRCVKVLVTGTQTPEELLDEVYTKLDSATEVAQEAVDAANSATQAVESAEKTLSEVTTYVDSSKSEINTLVTDATNSINTTVSEATTNFDNTISQAVNDVKTEAVAAAESAIQDAANTAIQIATDHANTVIIPPLQEYVDNARESATSAEESSLSASASALSASQSASNALVSETNAKNSASEAALHNLKNKLTNCITEIPQNIKLELDNGTLTLKAGSKLYQPNGAGVFTEINITSDKTRVGGGVNRQTMFFWDTAANGIRSRYLEYITSGTTAPTDFSNSPTWYDTTENKIKFYSAAGTIESSSGCLPLCICSSDASGTITSIDQVFNGFGYVGSTIFALPGVKGLIPNGRNEDGSLKNIETTVNKVAVYTFASNVNTPYNGRFLLNSSGGIFARVGGYDPVRNYITASDGVNILSGCSFAEGCLVEAGVIKTFNSKLPFRAVDANDLENKFNQLNNPYSLLDYKWSEYALNNASWLQSTGAFHSGNTYSAVYNLLVNIQSGKETKAGVSVKLSTASYSDTDFVINTTNKTFRFPIKVKLASGNAVVGNGMTLGLTNGTQNVGVAPNSQSFVDFRTGAYGKPVGTATANEGTATNTTLGVTTDPTKSGIETSSSGLKLYFYVGETVQDASLIYAGKALEQLATKTDIAQASTASMPSTKYTTLTAGATGASYTAPANGYYTARYSAKGGTICFENTSTGICNGNDTGASLPHGAYIPAKKGEVVKLHYNNGAPDVFRFVYAEGVK